MATLREGGLAILARSPLSWRGLGALLMGILLARWVWIFFAPQAMAIAVVPEHGTALEAGRLFGHAASGAGSAQGMALSNVQLVGVFAASPDQPGFAILKLDDKRQVGVAVGGIVVPGTKLFAAHPDYVLLESGGVQQRVNLIGKRSSVGQPGSDDARENERAMALSRPNREKLPENITIPERIPVPDPVPGNPVPGNKNNEITEKAGEGSTPASAVPKIGMPK